MRGVGIVSRPRWRQGRGTKTVQADGKWQAVYSFQWLTRSCSVWLSLARRVLST